MTHTLHRMGTPESLSGDYIFLMMPAFGINNAGSAPKLRKFFEIARRHNPVNMGDAKRSNMHVLSIQELMDKIDPKGTVVHAVYDSEEAAARALKDLKEADLGLSLVVSGIFSNVKKMCQKNGIHRHGVNYSLGIWGKTEKLPPENVLEITTMCGHGLVSATLVTSLAEDVKAGRKTAESAAKEMAKMCDCGVFNPVRASKLVSALAATK